MPNHETQIDLEFNFPFYGYRFNYTYVRSKPKPKIPENHYRSSSDQAQRPARVRRAHVHTTAVHIPQRPLARPARSGVRRAVSCRRHIPGLSFQHFRS